VLGKAYPVFVMLDNDLAKQQRIKEIRAANKTASVGYGKKNISKSINNHKNKN
jgi:hypothetical protein